MKSFLTIILTTLLSIVFLDAKSQLQKTCGHDHVMQKARTDNPSFDADYTAFLERALNENNLERLNDTVYKVQVVFHILYKANDAYQNVSDELVYSQLDALNRDFNMRNEDTSDTRDIFKPFAGNAKIEFELAKRRPNGNCANGIIRKTFNAPENLLPIFSDFLIKENLFGGSSAWNTRKYLNIWVMDLNKGRDPEEGFLGGYAYFPDMTPVAYNGVVLDYRFFGQDNPYIADVLPAFERYAKGRACVHEVGHWLGLRHVWGDLGTLDPTIGCSADDGIGDTPNSATAYASNGLCTDTIVNSCLDEPIDYPDMFENFMDYSTDDCQSMYTLEQVTVMRAALTELRPEVIFEEIPNTTETLEAEIIEGESIELCFDLGDCFGFGAMSAAFCDGDSSYISSNGTAQLLSDDNCFTYTAISFNENNPTDAFCIVVYDEHLQTYDTTEVTIEVAQVCPTSDTIYMDAGESTVFEECIDVDPCLDGVGYFITFCDNTVTFDDRDFVAGITDLCINFSTGEYEASNNQVEVCVRSHYDNSDFDTTIYVVDISQATGIDVTTDQDNGFDVYPNPSTGLFLLTGDQVTVEDIDVKVLNTSGQILERFTILKGNRSLQLDLADFPEGNYILQLSTVNKISFEKLTILR